MSIFFNRFLVLDAKFIRRLPPIISGSLYHHFYLAFPPISATINKPMNDVIHLMIHLKSDLERCA